MAFLHLVPKEQFAESEIGELAQRVYRKMDFVPTTVQILAGRHELARGYLAMAQDVMDEPEDLGLTFLATLVCSRAAQCRYCTSHAARMAALTGAPIEKVRAAVDLRYHDNELFTERDKAVCRFAEAAGGVPNQIEKKHNEDLARFLSESEVLKLAGIIAMMGFLNRFNDTVASPLEPESAEFAERHLGGTWWNPGKHATAEPPQAFVDARQNSAPKS